MTILVDCRPVHLTRRQSIDKLSTTEIDRLGQPQRENYNGRQGIQFSIPSVKKSTTSKLELAMLDLYKGSCH